jgi:hypothetical protein
MTNEQKLREFAEKWCLKVIEVMKGDDYIMHDLDGCLSDLTALIEEHYYPKEFTNYCIKNVDYCRDMGKEWYQIMASGILILKTLDDVYNYWKENEQ